jgi:K+-transporting ATPase c subunit
MTSETAPTPSASATAKSALAFKTEAATQAASAYLNAYNTLINDTNARTSPKGTDPETAISNAMAQLQKIAQDNAEVTKQENRVQKALTPEEVQRLLQYRKTLEESAQTGSNEL